MKKSVWKSPLFLIGFFIITSLFLGSIIYSHYVPNSKQPEMLIRYNKDKIPIDTPPIAPFKDMPFGTDRFGVSMLHKVLDGAKYTLGFSFIIAFCRLFLGTILGLIFSQLPKSLLDTTKRICEAFYYAPATIIAYLLMYPMLQVFTWSIPRNTQIIFCAIVLIVIAVPPLIVSVATETKQFLKNEFISSVKVLGGSRFHILWKHVFPHLRPRLGIFYSQQVISVLLLIAHLGVLKVFIGGYDIITLDPLENNTVPVAMINEWSSMIGAYFYEIRGNRWVVFAPLAGFAVSILSLNFMVEALKRQYLSQGAYIKSFHFFRKKNPPVTTKKITDVEFDKLMKRTGTES